jgi:hypothetical protein
VNNGIEIFVKYFIAFMLTVFLMATPVILLNFAFKAGFQKDIGFASPIMFIIAISLLSELRNGLKTK